MTFLKNIFRIMFSVAEIFLILSVNQYISDETWDRILLCGVKPQQLLIIELIMIAISAAINVTILTILCTNLQSYLNIEDHVSLIALFSCISILGSMIGLFASILTSNFSLLSGILFSLMLILAFGSGAFL